MNFNRVVLMGRLTRDPESKPAGESTVCKFALAVNRKRRDKEEVMFIECTAWGKCGEIIQQYLHKGSSCLVEGRLVLEKWTSDQGAPRQRHSITVESMQMLGDKKSDDNQSQRSSSESGQGGGSQPEPQSDEVPW